MSVHSARAKSWLAAILLAFVAFAPGSVAAEGLHRPFHRIVVFGDSLSDPGNAFALNGGQTVAPPDYGMTGVDSLGIPEVVSLVPEAPYETRRFSNGVTWIELLAGVTGLGSNAKPAFVGSDGRASNYAVGGATAFGARPVDLSGQVDNFFADFDVQRRGAPPDALYVIAIGGNDIRAALQLGPGVISAALQSVGRNIARLYGAGARNFLIWNVPDLGHTPALQRLNTVVPGIAAGATALVVGLDGNGGYNGGLKALLHLLSTAPASAGGLPGIEIVQFDAFGSLAAVQANPRRFGLIDATTACIQPNVPQFGFPSAAPFRCAQPDRWLFWDGIHPTRAGHAIIAVLVGKTLITAALHDH